MLYLFRLIVLLSIGTFCLYANAIEQDLFENSILSFPNSAPDEVVLRSTAQNYSNDILSFDEEVFKQTYPNLYVTDKVGKSNKFVKTDARRKLVSSHEVATELAEIGFPAIWAGKKGLSKKGRALVSFINKSYIHGLNPKDYLPSPITNKLSPEDIEFVASKAFIDLTKDLMLGKLVPEKADPNWHIRQKDNISTKELLLQAFISNDITEYLNNKLPQISIYKSLTVKLKNLLRKKFGWSNFPKDGPIIKPKSKHPHVVFLRKRLVTGGFLAKNNSSNYFDDDLKKALIKYQSQHGLNKSGILTKQTRLSLSIPIERRIVQLQQSLERLRWMPNFLPSKYILVNSAGSELYIIKNNSAVLNMRTVVGQKRKDDDNYTETPSFSNKLRHIIVNPEWYVPQSIIRKEFLLAAQKDSDFFARNNYNVYDPAGKVQFDPKDIDWSKFTEEDEIPYQVRQGIGNSNALGRIKFMFPNKYSIYLHDTPMKSLFKHERRFYSHGCVRLSRPLELASSLLNLPERKIKKIVSTEKKTKIVLDKKVPIYIAYLTVWAKNDGTVVFYDDHYGLDRRMDFNYL